MVTSSSSSFSSCYSSFFTSSMLQPPFLYRLYPSLPPTFVTTHINHVLPSQPPACPFYPSFHPPSSPQCFHPSSSSKLYFTLLLITSLLRPYHPLFLLPLPNASTRPPLPNSLPHSSASFFFISALSVPLFIFTSHHRGERPKSKLSSDGVGHGLGLCCKFREVRQYEILSLNRYLE